MPERVGDEAAERVAVALLDRDRDGDPAGWDALGLAVVDGDADEDWLDVADRVAACVLLRVGPLEAVWL